MAKSCNMNKLEVCALTDVMLDETHIHFSIEKMALVVYIYY